MTNTTRHADPTEHEWIPAYASQPKLPLWSCTVLDAAAARSVDPCAPSVFPFFATGTEAITLRVGEVEAFRLTPIDAGTPTTGHIGLDFFDLICEQQGFADSGEDAGEAWVKEGTAAMEAAMPTGASGGGLAAWRGENEAARLQAQAIGRWYGMTAEEIMKVTGVPFVVRKTMLEPMARARVLSEARAEADANAAAARASATRVKIEAERPKTWLELGAQGLRVKRDRCGVVAPEPFVGACLLHDTADSLVFGWRPLPGLSVPAGFYDAGIEVIPLDEIAPQLELRPPLGRVAIPELDTRALVFVRALRAKAMVIHAGPIAKAAFGDRGLVRACQLADEYADIFLRPVTVPNGWRRGWLLEAIVRGCLVRPDLATMIVYSVLGKSFDQNHSVVKWPTQWAPFEKAAEAMKSRPGYEHVSTNPERATRDISLFLADARPAPGATSGNAGDVGTLAANAAMRGGINPGELLDEPTSAPKPDAPEAPQVHTKKK
jgi:hypothetical protein